MGNITEVARKIYTNKCDHDADSLEVYDAEMVVGRWMRTEVAVIQGKRIAQSTRCLGSDDVSPLLAMFNFVPKGIKTYQGTRDVYRCRACRNNVEHTVDLHNEYVRCTREGDVAPPL